MATQPAVGRPKAKKKAKSSQGSAVWLLLSMLLLALIFARQTLLVLALALLPTFVAGIVDRREGKYAMWCVGGFNMAGTVPWVFHMLWAGGEPTTAMVDLLMNPFAWLSIYGAAGIGWLIYFWVPMAVVRWQEIRDGQRVKSLRNRQAVLLEEWGRDLVDAAPGKL